MTSVPQLPQYTPSAGAPEYAAEPQEDELRLAFVDFVPAATQQVPFECRSGDISMILRDQEPGIKFPTYAQNAIVRGQVSVVESDILSVILEVSGKWYCCCCLFISRAGCLL